MANKIIKGVAVSLAVYTAFFTGVVMYYPDKPEKMDWEDRQDFNKVQIEKISDSGLENGISHKEILTMLGGPDISEAKMSGADKIQVMYYRTQHKRADGITSQDECTPLLFKNDKLVALGEKAEKQFENEY
ncbi:DUF3192 domain-containing protein [Planctobacterium marinum]|uniref:DUF3192 domain-containing protein n=1 Tax=Planctobacterium marinum TaxID=1631968 RepID=UPI001E5D496B|nr:DUF3192 domain-containing protein [Planctobacterium marinum]MCC2606081.1 DUF3192 domain-containing protein [Planctobacterium marinum]